MENVLLETIAHVKNIGEKKPTVNRLLAHIYNWANSWDVLVVEETLCILCTKGIINENYKFFAPNDKNDFPSEDKLLQTPLFSSNDDILLIPV